MTDLTRRQLFKAVFSAAATVALAKTTALKLSAPLLTDVRFEKSADIGWHGDIVPFYRASGYYNGHKAFAYIESTLEAQEDSAIDEPMFELCYRELVDFVLENPLP